MLKLLNKLQVGNNYWLIA